MTLLSSKSDMSVNKRRLRMWIRMLRTTRFVEARLREFLRDKYDTTLPRFDVMAALYRSADGLKMSELSKLLLVSNGNVTGIIERLVTDALVLRVNVEGDRRAMLVCLTDQGRKVFEEMAREHEALINDLFADLDGEDLDELVPVLSRLKAIEDKKS
ncbi:MarR family transcriptional regulator [Kiloniella laminariae]|uniref:MarR family transcriptional regulator n=1 Tax=Kiloniella laminariae TaxID=454162 RepID=A0ABT4LP68_9PROT|nr:MarR family transcriptional regulator [Kiloniella laminariae]MCZ4282690.1 MarR family transcriptional regulator [Kiloniella laminariae]